MRTAVALMLLIAATLPVSRAGCQRGPELAYLVRDPRLGVTFFAPEGFLPNPEEAVRKKARHFWYGKAQPYSRWGFMTFHRTGPIRGLDPTYWREVLEKRWGPAEGPPREMKVADGDALVATTLTEDEHGRWAILSLLVPVGEGVFDLTLFGPSTQRTRLQRLLTALAQGLRVRLPRDPRPFTLPGGVSLTLPASWTPVGPPRPGLLFQALRSDGRYELDLSLVPAVSDAAVSLRAALGLPHDRPLETRPLEMPGGCFLTAQDPQQRASWCAVLLRAGDALLVQARLPAHKAQEEFESLLATIRVAPPLEVERTLRRLASDLRGSARASTAVLRRKLDELLPFAGHPAAAEALGGLLDHANEEAVFEAALLAADLAPFGPDAATLSAALILALGKCADVRALDTLRKELHSPELGLACAAVEAVGYLPFGKGEAMDALVTLYESLSQSGRAGRGATRGSSQDPDRYRMLYFPILTALRRQSDRDFPHPGGAEAARKWLEERRK
jgi:hypothetical protein